MKAFDRNYISKELKKINSHLEKQIHFQNHSQNHDVKDLRYHFLKTLLPRSPYVPTELQHDGAKSE